MSKELGIFSGHFEDSSIYHLLKDKNKNSKLWNSYKKHLRILKILLAICAFAYAFAFLLWNIDNIYCIHLINIRNKYKQCSFLFQLHSKLVKYIYTFVYMNHIDIDIQY